jgi:protease I
MIGKDATEEYKGKNGAIIKPDVSAENISAESLDILVIPGGKAPEKLRKNKDMVSLVKNMHELSKPIVAICHGPLVLIETGFMGDKKATGHKEIKKDLLNAGSDFVNKAVVIDNNIITSRKPEDIPNFIEAIDEYVTNYI